MLQLLAAALVEEEVVVAMVDQLGNGIMVDSLNGSNGTIEVYFL